MSRIKSRSIEQMRTESAYFDNLYKELEELRSRGYRVRCTRTHDSVEVVNCVKCGCVHYEINQHICVQCRTKKD